MTFTSLDSIGKTNIMLDLISQRQRALGSNVANVDTPGYVRRDIDFSQYLGSMNSPLETKLSTELGPSGVIEDRRKTEVDIAEELGIDGNIISKVPIILYFKDGSLATTHGIHTAKEFEDLLETQDIRSQ